MTEPNDRVRIAVVGTGDMGSNHARVIDMVKGAELACVVDPVGERAEAAAGRHGCAWATSAEEIGDDIDAVTIATPSSLHAAVAVPLLERGFHCLIEKPLATNDADAAAIVQAAEANGVRVLVGHVERFNPAVTQLKTIIADAHDLIALDARRMSAVSSRITDVDVVSDLMIHDLDIVLDLVRQPVVDVVARGAARTRSRGRDYVTAVLTFADGVVATLTASRVTQNQVRELQVTTTRRFYTVDYVAQELLVYRQGRIGSLDEESPNHGRYTLDVGTERVFVRRSEPLVLEMQHFVEVVRGAEPVVSAVDAHAALRVAWTIQEHVEGTLRHG